MHKPALQTPSHVVPTWPGALQLRARARGPARAAAPDTSWLAQVPAAARDRLSARALRLLRSMD